MKHSTKLLASIYAAAALLLACGNNSNDNDYRDEVSETTSLLRYDTCSALEDDLKEVLIAELDTYFDQFGIGIPVDDALEGGGAPPPSAEPGRQEGRDFSGTNNQEAGVDEADFVKSDGYHVCVLNGDRLHLFDVPEFGDLVPAGELSIEGWPSQMLLDSEADKVVVFSSVSTWELPEDDALRAHLTTEIDDGHSFVRAPNLSKISVIDIADSNAPTLIGELYLEGGYQTARLVDSTVRMGAYSAIQVPGLYDIWGYYDYGEDPAIAKERAKSRARAHIRAASLNDLVPQIYSRDSDGAITPHQFTQEDCGEFYRPLNSHARGFTSIMTLDLGDREFQYDADHILSNYSTIYATAQNLYIAEPANDWWWFWWNDDHPEQLNIHAFFTGTDSESRYVGSGRVEGVLLNQFSMDEHEGHLRVATTTNQWRQFWDEEPPARQNHIYVLSLDDDGGEFDIAGHVGGIAEGESIFAARMMGDRGFLVTFEQIDPLFTLDLSDPGNPRVIGELELPGFSTYIHPLDDDTIITIGVGGDANGANWLTQVSMFDVGDFAAPAIKDQEMLINPQGWGSSEAQYEHKAFQYWAPENMLALPLSFSSESVVDGRYSWTYESKLELLKVDAETGFERYGSIDHSHFFASDAEAPWAYVDVRRSIFMGDYIYAISDRGITVHDLDDLSAPVAEAPLPGYVFDRWYEW